LAAECESFLDNVVAQFASQAGGRYRAMRAEVEVTHSIHPPTPARVKAAATANQPILRTGGSWGSAATVCAIGIVPMSLRRRIGIVCMALR